MLTIEDGIIKPLGWYVKHTHLPPEIEVYAESIPGRDGDYVFGQNFKARLVTLDLVSPWTTDKNLEQRKLMSAFRHDCLIEIDGWFLRGRVSPKIDVIGYPHNLTATVPLKLLEPFMWQEQELTSNGVLQNDGNVEIYPFVELFNNTSINIGDETLTYFGIVEHLIIDCEHQTVTADGENGLKNYNGVFPCVLPGAWVEVYSNGEFRVTWRNRR